MASNQAPITAPDPIFKGPAEEQSRPAASGMGSGSNGRIRRARSGGHRGQKGGRRLLLGMAVIGVLALLASPAGAATVHVNWPGYLNGPSHSSYQVNATEITPTSAPTLVPAWSFVPPDPPIPALGRGFDSSPTVFNGVIYIGATNGTFYALRESTGQVLWERAIGFVPEFTAGCAPHGFVATATVAKSPSTGKPTVYVAAPDGYLYAFDAKTGATVWRSVIAIPSETVDDYFDWSSPTVADGRIYVGLSSHCDQPLIRAGLLAFDQGSGTRLATFSTVGPLHVGASVWSSAAVATDRTVYATTGNGPTNTPSVDHSVSILALDGRTLHLLSDWKVPGSEQPGTDSDFGASPTLFSAALDGQTRPTAMVAACNKNGTVYAWRAHDLAAGPVWQRSLGSGTKSQCIAAAAWDGSHLFVAGNAGGVDELDPATGNAVWAVTLPEGVLGSPTIDGAGVLSVPTYTGGDFLLDAATGATLATVSTGEGGVFAQPVFADNYLLVASLGAGITAYQPGGPARPAICARATATLSCVL